jgi:hypothetical protein
MEHRNVTATRQLNQNRVRAPLGFIVETQLRAQSPCLDPDDGISAGIKRLAAFEHGYTDQIFLEPHGAVAQLLFHRELQKPA